MADEEQQPLDPRAEQLGTETPEPVAVAPSPPPEPEPKKEERTDWRLLELGQTRRQLEEERVARERLEAENRRLTELAQATMRREGQTAELPAPRLPQPEPLDSDLERRVEQRVQERILNDRAAQLDAALRQNFAEDYQTILGNFGHIQNSMRLMFDDIVATGEGAYVAATVGRDPDRIQQLRDMPAAQRRMALLKIALEKPAATEEPARVETHRPSAAPPPPAPAPIGGAPPAAAGSSLYDDRYNFVNYYSGDIAKEYEADSRWFAERKRQKMNSTGRPWSLPQNR